MKLKRKPSFLPLLVYNPIFVMLNTKRVFCVLKNQFEYQISTKTALPVVAEGFGLFHSAN